ncbi:MAG: exosome complex exonuclease Rrp41 [Candidatus Micrarchaeia archaeon]
MEEIESLEENIEEIEEEVEFKEEKKEIEKKEIEAKEKLIVNGKRIDGRDFDELRKFEIYPNVLKKANGSAYIEWGKNKILAAVYGPREVIPKHVANPYKAVVRARYLMAPFSSLEGRNKPGPNRRSIEISKVIKHIFEDLIFTEKFPNTAIDIFIEVLEGNGSTRCVGINAAGVALIVSGIPMRDIPVAVSVGKINGNIIVDLIKEEGNYGEADMPLAFLLDTEEILLMQMDGKMSIDEFKKAIELAFEKGKIIRERQIEAIKNSFKVTTE